MKAQIRPCFKASVQKDGTLEMLVYNDIGETGVSASDMKYQMDSAGNYDKIRVRINSPGGDAFEGVAMHNLLRAQGKPVEVCVDGLAASCASIVAMAGDEITMGSNAMMMIHNAWSACVGNSEDLRKMADTLDKVSGSIAQTYVDRTSNSMDDVRAMMDAETWLSAKDCMDKGFATRIAEEPDERSVSAMALARSFITLKNFKHNPFKNQLADALEQATQSANKLGNSLDKLKNDDLDKASACACDCSNCTNMDCSNCTNQDCTDKNCMDCPMQQKTETANAESNLSLYEARVALLTKYRGTK